MARRAAPKQSGKLDERFIRSVALDLRGVEDREPFPWSLPMVQALARMKALEFHPRVTFIVGENGTGKSTLIEGIASAARFGEQGGSKNFNHGGPEWAPLAPAVRLTRGIRHERDGFFLRAESSYNVGTELVELNRLVPGAYASYGGIAPHAQSHGEWFLAMLTKRLGGNGLYILDEPEAALSPSRQLAFLRVLKNLAEDLHSQFIIATHSPIIMAYPDADIWQLTDTHVEKVRYEDTEHFQLTRDFLNRPAAYLTELFADFD